MPSMQAQALLADEDGVQSDGVDSDRFSGSNSSFLANERLVSVDSINSDVTGTFLSPLKYLHVLDGLSESIKCFPDDDSHDMPDDELQLYFSKLVPPVMQRGRVEGQEIPATVSLPSILESLPGLCAFLPAVLNL